MTPSNRTGHAWRWGYDDCGRTVRTTKAHIHSAHGRGPFERIESSPTEIELLLDECESCCLLRGALWWTPPHTEEPKQLLVYGFLLDAMTLMGSAPPCDPHVLSRQPRTAEAA